MKAAEERASRYDAELVKGLSTFDLLMIVIGSVLGGSWLFGAYYSAIKAGPASIISWVLAGILLMFVGLVYGELGSAVHKSGGLVRLPQYAQGSLASFIQGWAYLLGIITVAPTETLGAVQYLSPFMPWAFSNGTITLYGGLVVFSLLTLFFLLNYFSVKLFGKVNTVIGLWKLVIPLLSVLLLFVLYFHPQNMTGLPGGFMPYGASPVFLAIPMSGIIYSYLGFRESVDYAGESENPKRAIPVSVIGGLAVMIALYTIIALGFIYAIDWAKLGVPPGDWAALKEPLQNGPFLTIFELSGITALVVFIPVLIFDAVISPSGTSIITTGVSTRTFYGLAADGHLPELFLKLNKWKIPVYSLVASWLLGALFIVPYPTWQALSSFISSTTVIAYLGGGPILIALRKLAPDLKRGFTLPFANVISPLAFISSTLLVYWSTYSLLYGVIALVLGGIPLFFIYTARRYGRKLKVALVSSAIYTSALAYIAYELSLASGLFDFSIYVLALSADIAFIVLVNYRVLSDAGKKHVRAATWILAMLPAILILSFIGPYGPLSAPLMPFPWDNLAVAVVSLAFYWWAVKSSFETEDLSALLRQARGSS